MICDGPQGLLSSMNVCALCWKKSPLVPVIILLILLGDCDGTPLKHGDKVRDSEDPLLKASNFGPEQDFHQFGFSLDPNPEVPPLDQDGIFDPSKINYAVLQNEIDNLVSELNEQKRQGKNLNLASVTQMPKFLSGALKYMDFKQVFFEIEHSLLSSVSCTACKAGVGLLQHYIKTGKTNLEIAHAAIKLCLSLKIETKRVCVGIISLFADEVIYIMERLILEPEEVCGIIVGDGCEVPYIPWHDWNITFPPIPKPPADPLTTTMSSPPVLKVLHLSDNHFDPHYAPGANADCGEPLCCRITDGPPENPKAAAGPWGDYRKCDTPLQTMENMYQHIAYTHPDIDYIYWTGDIPPHDVWNQTHEEQLHVIQLTVKQLLDFFPHTPILPALGNHESAPVNSFPPPNVKNHFSIQWLYDELDRQWRRWLPDSASQTVRYGAYYAVPLRKGLKVISLNMNYCHNKNWWLLLNTTDPAQELQWLVYELQAAELNGEKVHILGHIPPGHSDCLKTWSQNYYRIINRYENTVVAQFFGHTHFDEFQLFYDEAQPTRAVSVAYIGPSVTPYYNLNPGYRVYTIEGDYKGSSYAVMDHENWYLDLKEANHYNHPRWRLLYSAKSSYGMRSLSPQEWDYLVHKLSFNDNLFQQYYKYYWKASPLRPKCDEECKKRLLCDLVSGRSNDRKNTCVKIEQRMSEQESSWRSWLVNGLTITGAFLLFLPLGFQIPSVFG